MIDIIIISNLFVYIDTIFYHYVKKAFLNEEDRLLFYMGSYILGTKGKLDTQYQELEILFGIKNELRYYLNEKSMEDLKRINKKNEIIDDFYVALERKRERSFIIFNRLFQRKSKFSLNFCNKNLLFSCYYTLFKKFRIFRLKNPYPYPGINIFTNFNDYYQWEGIN